jgi:hypothetical protein
MPSFGESRQGRPMLQRIMDCLSQTVFRQHRVHCVVEPGLELGEQRDGLFLPLPQPSSSLRFLICRSMRNSCL